MSIPFPKLHIAASALNRILNAVEGEKSFGLNSLDMAHPPTVPNTSLEDTTLDAKLNAPLPPADVPPQDAAQADQNAAATSALGGSPFDGALLGIAGAPN